MTPNEQIDFIERELSDCCVMYNIIDTSTRKLLKEDMSKVDRSHLEWSLTKLHTALHYLEEALKQHKQELQKL